MRRSSKVLIVAGGYAAALLIALAVVRAYVAATGGLDRQSSPGMFAFGDDLLFLGVFGVAAIPATSAALFFLRPFRLFWRLASFGALAIAATGVAALLDYLLPPSAGVGSSLGAWSGLSPLRILVAPLFGLAFFLSSLFAPTRLCRVALICATIIEAGVFVRVALIWFHPFR